MKAILSKTVLTIAMLLAATGFASAQSYTLTPNDSIVMWGYFEDLQTLTINQVNNTQDTLHFKWQKIGESVPAQWDASVCDNKVCYTSLIDTGTMNPVGAGEYGFVLLHITPRLNYGTAVVRYAVWETSTPNQRDTLTFILISDGTSGMQPVSENRLSVFPTIASAFVRVSMTDALPMQIFMMDAGGRVVFAERSAASVLTIPVESLPNGIYFLAARTTGNIVTRKIIVQHR
jgi:hypothetical protein